MDRYAQAWVQRVSHGQAISQARALVPGPRLVTRDWDDGCVSLVPCVGADVAITHDPSEWRAVSVWISAKVVLEFPRSELLWRMLSACEHRLVFELAGNASWVRFFLRCHRDDLQTVRESFVALYPACAMTEDSSADWWKGGGVSAYHEVCGPWTADRLTISDELPDSPLWACVEWLLSLSKETVGFYQCVFEPASEQDDWHRRIEVQHDLSFLSRLILPQTALQRVPQQVPSGELRGRAEMLAGKANPDLPFFGVMVRCGIVADTPFSGRIPRAVSTFRFGGNALVLRPAEVAPIHLREVFFRAGASCRPGLVLNSSELTALAHLLPVREEVSARTDWPVCRADVSPAQASVAGSVIGFANQTGMQIPIAIPPDIRARGTHVVSSAGMGKTTLLKHLFLQDVSTGNGAVYIDPHGDALKDLAALIPVEDRARCVYLNPSDPDWVPCWNPLIVPPGGDLYRVADDLLSAIERVSRDWGDRLATVLRHALIGLLHVPGVTMHDLYNVVRQKSPESDELRARILATCPDQAVRQFWERDFLTSYREADLAAPRHKLLKLVSGGAVSRMFSQQESRIDVRTIMDEGRIMLVDLSGLGEESRKFLGSFLLTLFVVAAAGRARQNREERKPFSIFADEAHLFVEADAFETLLAQARKFRVNVVLAHQYLRQFKIAQVDAILTAGTTLVGRVDRADATILAKDFQGKVTADDITRLPPFEMVGRVGTEIVRFRTPPNNDRYDPAAVAAVIEQSRARYYVRATAPVVPKKPEPKTYDWSAFRDADLSYDEF